MKIPIYRKDIPAKTIQGFILPMIFFLGFILSANSGLKAQAPSSLTNDLFKKFTAEITPYKPGSVYYAVKYNDINCGGLRGVQFIRNVTPTLAIIKLKDISDKLLKAGCIEAIAPANDLWKLSVSFEEIALAKDKKAFMLFTVTATDINVLLSSFRNKNLPCEAISVFKESQSGVIRCRAADFITYCLADTSLIFADKYVVAKTEAPVPGYNRDVNTINLVDYFIPGATGKGIVIGIKENKPNEADIDLQKRVLPSVLASSVTEDHATVVATLVGGAGNSFYTAKGSAWKCNFFPSSFSNLFPDSSNLLIQKNVTVQNHAYGTGIQSVYGAEALSYDVQTAQNKILVHVFSSGNRGTENAPSGTYANITGFANITGNFKMAKNIITVAAVDTAANLAPFSSAGPLHDGRLGPQITALGPNGTSEAAGIVSGAVAVLQQVYKDSNTQILPPASLIKALLYNTAKDIGNKGIDYRSGFGLLDVYNAVLCLQQKKYDSAQLQQSQVWTKDLLIPAQAANLKITLAWTDTAATVNTNRALVNDLDLEVTEMNSGFIYKPWVLSTFPNIDSLKKFPVRKRDSLNTAEQVSQDLPAAGIYRISVKGQQIQTFNKQSFNIAYNWDTLNRFRFTNPVSPGDIVREENPNLKIKWKVAVADTNTTGDLLITYNAGATWQTIGTGIKLYRQFFNWVIPDTTAIAQLRMDCPFGTFTSSPFVIAPLTKINVDYLCPNTLRLSWQNHTLANFYKLYVLGDTAFIKPILNITDTFIVINRTLMTENIFAVEPVISNGPAVARSEAIDVRRQGVNCYYRTLLADPAGDSVRLSLELSYLPGADSIIFEKTDRNGNILRRIAKINIISGQYIYTIFDNSPADGVNYYRAKIWISGTYVYTDIVSVIHTGKKFLFLYPNPITRGQVIKVLIKERTGKVNLQVLDIAGRIMANYSMSIFGEIETQGFAAGIYFYKLSDTKAGTLQTGKFIIQ